MSRVRPRPQAYCRTPEPGAACVRFVPVELAFVTRRFRGDGGRGASGGVRLRPYLGIESGVLRNTGPRSAWGPTVMVGVGNAIDRAGARLRYRRWFGLRSPLPHALDVSAGPLAAAVYADSADGPRPGRLAPGVGGDVSVEAAGVVAVSLRPEVVWLRGRPAGAVAIGVRTGTRLTANVGRLLAGLVTGIAAVGSTR